SRCFVSSSFLCEWLFSNWERSSPNDSLFSTVVSGVGWDSGRLLGMATCNLHSGTVSHCVKNTPPGHSTRNLRNHTAKSGRKLPSAARKISSYDDSPAPDPRQHSHQYLPDQPANPRPSDQSVSSFPNLCAALHGYGSQCCHRAPQSQ